MTTRSLLAFRTPALRQMARCFFRTIIYWRTALSGDTHVVGRTLPVGKAVLTIRGVLPAGFTGTNRGLLVDLFVPPATFFGSLGYKDHLDQRVADFEVVGRLQSLGTIEPRATGRTNSTSEARSEWPGAGSRANRRSSAVHRA
jgi:hypothetical protein